MTVMDDEKLPKTIEDGTSSHLERTLEIDPAIEKRQVVLYEGMMINDGGLTQGDC